MGDVIHYLKAVFSDPAKALFARDEFYALLDDLVGTTESLWEDVFAPEGGVEQLLTLHPRAASLLRYMDPPACGWTIGELLHWLPSVDFSYWLEVRGSMLRLRAPAYSGNSWDLLRQWLFEHGAVQVGWASEDQLDPFQYIQLSWVA